MKLFSILDAVCADDRKEHVLDRFASFEGEEYEADRWPYGTSAPYYAHLNDGLDVHELTFRFGPDDRVQFVELAAGVSSPDDAALMAKLYGFAFTAKLGRGVSKGVKLPERRKLLYGRRWKSKEGYKLEVVAEQELYEPSSSPAYLLQRLYFQ